MRRQPFILFAIFAVGVMMRAYFGYFRPTGDLEFYTILEESQQTLFGIDKELRFYPLLVFDSEEARILALAVITAFLNVLALWRLLQRSGQSVTILILLISISNWYFAQIDMHLVRQQLAIYLFILTITQYRFGVVTVVLGLLSVFYHEVALLLFASWFVAWTLAKYHLTFTKNLLLIGAFAALPALYILIDFNGVIFLAYTMIGFLLVKKETESVSLGNVISIMTLAVLALNIIGFISHVNSERTVGVIVSLSLFRLMFSGAFQLSERWIKLLGLLMTLSAYGLVAHV